jgi:ATP/maltotriose-dependent transcriptional regulator MalT
LTEGLKKRLMLISAPGGYGKATLVVQWMDQVRRNSARLTLEKNDSDNAIPIDFALRHAITASGVALL